MDEDYDRLVKVRFVIYKIPIIKFPLLISPDSV